MLPARQSSLEVSYLAHEGESHSLNVLEWGERDNPDVVFCIHGLTRNAHDFAYIAAALAERFRVVAVDMPGRGGSEWLRHKDEYNYAAYLANIRAVMDALALPAVHWLGTSMGGIIGMMVAAGEKQRVRTLVLNDIGAFISADALRRIGAYVTKRMRFTSDAEAAAAMREIYAPYGITQEEHWQHLLRYDLKASPDGAVVRNYDPAIGDAFNNPEAIAEVDLSAFWNVITCPAMIVHGEQSDVLTATTIQKMREIKPETEVLSVPGVGHAPALFTADQIRPVREYLLRHS